MKKTLMLFLLTSILGLSSCDSLTPEEVGESIIEGTKDQVPLLVQQLMFVDTLTVDSIHLMVETEPMSGYLYTTWTAGGTSTPVIVEVTDIKKSKTSKGYIEWQADWKSAAKAFYTKALLGDLESLIP